MMGWMSLGLVVGVGFAMIAAHETAHAVATRVFGGRWEGVVFAGIAVGVRVRVDGLTPRQILATLVAAPLTEGVVVLVAWLFWPGLESVWALLLSLQWALNWCPWLGFPNDGRRAWSLLRHGTVG